MAIYESSVQSRSVKHTMLFMNGAVYLIGAGPGDPGLLTVRGAELLAQADVVLYDGLSNPDLLQHAPQAEQICVGKHGKSRIWKQNEIIDEILSHAKAGKTVVRLKGGDPAIFARTAEEVEAIKEAGLTLEIVPGITAALAAGSYAGIPVTHRGLASAVAFVTGHEEPSKSESALDWEALARFPGTLVIYMGVTTAESWTQALLQAGKAAETPAALVRRCSLPDQQTIHCRLDEVAAQLSPASRFRPPVIVILGAVTQLARTMNWIEERPLLGQTVLVTRPEGQAQALVKPLRELGARVLQQPAIAIEPPEDWQSVDAAITELSKHDMLIFCSHNGVRFFLNRLEERGGDMRALAGIQIGCVGKKTAAALHQFHLLCDLLPDTFHAEAMAKHIGPQANEKRIMVIRASRGNDQLAAKLETLGGHVSQVIAYQHSDVQECDPSIRLAVSNGEVDWITVTSSATAHSLHRMFSNSMDKMKIASLSPVTSKQLIDLGYAIAAEASPYTIEALVESLVRAEQ
jgi:uroporphyrinogen III methyltransferase / synthase